MTADDRPATGAPSARRTWRTAVGAVLVAAVLWVLWVIRFEPWVAHNDFAVMRVSLERMLDGHVPTVQREEREQVDHAERDVDQGEERDERCR